MPSSLCYLSIIVPAYNEENRLPDTLEQLHQFLEQQNYLAEVIIVENGSQDRTFEVAQAFASQHTKFRVVRETKRGKGLAVQRGMFEARGAYRFMCDADLSMPVNEINRFLPPALTDFDVAIASREAPGAVRYNEPAYRHLGGRAINTLIRTLALPGLQDTQCGFKCFRAEVAENLFKRQSLPGWSFDIEILYIARLSGYQIVEIPILWYFNADSKLNAFRDAWQMGKDILLIRQNERHGLYR
jgi:dolichyl-phosphate beta-glucosyltransferase